MRATTPLDPTDDNAQDLYAYLESLEPGNANTVAFTVMRDIEAIARGDANEGAVSYVRACMPCHGEMHSGSGRLNDRVPILPEDGIASHAGYSSRLLRLVFTEKIRHGGFWGYGGDMPPFSIEVMNDRIVADILEAMGVLGE